MVLTGIPEASNQGYKLGLIDARKLVESMLVKAESGYHMNPYLALEILMGEMQRMIDKA